MSSQDEWQIIARFRLRPGRDDVAIARLRAQTDLGIKTNRAIRNLLNETELGGAVAIDADAVYRAAYDGALAAIRDSGGIAAQNETETEIAVTDFVNQFVAANQLGEDENDASRP